MPEETHIPFSKNFSNGYAFIRNTSLSGNEIVDLFNQTENFESFCALNKQLNGMYCVCVTVKDAMYLYVSPGGFYKLFYTSANQTYLVSEKASELASKLFNNNAINEFRTSLYCLTDNTLYQSVFAVEPGEAIALTPNGIVKKILFNYSVNTHELFNHSYNSLKATGIKTFSEVIDRMIMYLNGRQAVIPLSGGYDSRFILSALVSRGYQNLLAFTYGTPNTRELSNAEACAKILCVNWVFIPYTESAADNAFSNINLNDYLHFMVNGNAFPSLHEIMAIQFLKNNQLISSDAVFIPGHSGDFLGGSQYIKVFPTNLKFESIASSFVHDKLSYFPLNSKDKEAITHKIRNLIAERYTKTLDPCSVFEDMDMREKLAKHILNASRAYLYFGYTAYFPFWDSELIHFFQFVSATYKIEKKLYNEILSEMLFTPMNINFPKELHPSRKILFKQKIKNKIKPLLPGYLKEKLLKKNDTNLYMYITKPWYITMVKNNFIPNNYNFNLNAVIAQWVVFNLLSKKD